MLDTHYPSRPEHVRLIPGVADALLAVNSRDIPVIVVTHQSGIGRGLLSEADYEAVRAQLEHELTRAGARVDAKYHCPHWNERTGPCECRKPGLGMYQQAAAEHTIDLARSGYVGDRWRDVAPALATGGIGVLVPGPATSDADIESARTHAHVVPSLRDAVDLFLAHLTGA